MITSLPLLHVFQRASGSSWVDVRVVFLAVLVFAAASVAVWRPRLVTGLRHRRGRRQFARQSVGLLLFLAVLPGVLPYDHLFPQHNDAGPQDSAVHASHCHSTPASCSDAPVTSGPGQLLMGAPLVVTPAMLAVLIMTTAMVLVGISFRPEIRPPLRLSA